MDERLEKALDHANYMVTLTNQKRLIHQKFLENCVHYLNGGKFTVNRELINFCSTLLSQEQDSCVLIDDNDIPIQVDDLQEFLDSILDIYFTSVNAYHAEYSKIRTNRKIEGLVDLWVKVYCCLQITIAI